MKKVIVFVLVLLVLKSECQVLSMREQAKVVDELLADRLNNLLPSLMEKNNIDLWILISREYNEDPVL